MKPNQRGAFITIEGGEGTGKSTLTSALREALPEGTIFTREPGGSAGAEAIRELLVTGEPGRWDAETETLLLNAARRDHTIRVIEPALAEGRMVICDRYVDSTRAYQTTRGVSRALIDKLHEEVIGLEPALTLILDAPAEIGLSRAGARGGDERFERMGLEFHSSLREALLDIAASEPERCVVIDATASPETILETALSAINKRFDPAS